METKIICGWIKYELIGEFLTFFMIFFVFLMTFVTFSTLIALIALVTLATARSRSGFIWKIEEENDLLKSKSGKNPLEKVDL